MYKKQLSLFIATLTCCASVFTLNAADSEGFVKLFNGKDLEGWETKGGKANYKVVDGAIVGTTVPNTPNTFLCTKKHYGDFILEFEFKASASMNSGCQFRSLSLPEYKNGRVHGYQCELEDEKNPRKWSGGIYGEGKRGWLYPTKAEKDKKRAAAFSAQGKKVWKNGDWNTIRIQAKGDHLQTWVNGQARADLKDDDTLKGFIALQVHGVGGNKTPLTVSWRNIRIKEL